MADNHEQAGPRPTKRSYATMAGEDRVRDAHHEAAHTQNPISSNPRDNTIAGHSHTGLYDQDNAMELAQEDENVEETTVAGPNSEEDVQAASINEEQHEAANVEDEAGVGAEQEEEDEDDEAEGTAAEGTDGHGNIPSAGHIATQWTPGLRAMARREMRSVRRRIQHEDYAESRAAGEWGSMLFAHAAAVAGAEREDADDNGDGDDEVSDDGVDEQEERMEPTSTRGYTVMTGRL